MGALPATACDQFATVEVNNHTAIPLVVTVNDGSPIVVPPDSRAYVGPGVNERLKSLEFQLMTPDAQRERLELDTYDELVIHAVGPPLQLEVSRADHPSPTWTPVPE